MLTLNLGMHDALVSGSTPRPEPVELVLLRDGEVIAAATAYPFPDASGSYLYAATLGYYYPSSYWPTGGGGGYACLVQAGDQLQAVQAGTAVSLTVPALTALADQSSATVYGQAPPSATLDVYLYPYDDASVSYHESITAGLTGAYALDFSSQTAVTTRDYGFVFYTNGSAHRVYRRYNVPFLQAGLDSHYVNGLVAPCTYVTLSLHYEGGQLYTPSYVHSYSEGDFYVYVEPALDTGHQIVVTAAGQVVSLTVPLLTALPDPVTDRVIGEAPPESSVQVDLYRGPQTAYDEGPPTGEPDASVIVAAETVGGIYAATFDDIRAGDYGVVYVANLAGHQTYRHFSVPFLRARLGDYRLDGWVRESGVLTVTVTGRSGLVRDVRTVYASDTGRFYDDDDWLYGGLRLLTGDRVSVTTKGGDVLALTMPALTARTNLASNTVYGQAPPRSPLRVGLAPANYYFPAGGGWPYPDYGYPYTLALTSTASGLYTADLSSLVTMTIRDQGAVFFVNPDGYEVVREFAVPYIRAQIGGDQVDGLVEGSGTVQVTLRDAAGQVKATATDDIYSGADSFQVHFHPAIIEAGDTIAVTTNEKVIVALVSPLSITVDFETDIISGVAPPYASLTVTCYGDGRGDQTWTISATGEGIYSLDVGGQVDITRGDYLSITYVDPDGNQFWTAQRITQLRAVLYDNELFVYGPPYAPFTLTLLAPASTSLYTMTGTLDPGGWTSSYPYDPVSWTPILLEPGQTITVNVGGEQLELSLPLLTAQVDTESDTISGLAPPGAALEIRTDWQTSYVTATAAGTYTLDLSGVVDIVSGSSGELIYRDAEDNQVLVKFSGPYLAVMLGESQVGGVAPSGNPVTVTLYDAGGNFKGSGRSDWGYDGSTFYVWLDDGLGNAVPVVAGDRILVQSPGGEVSFVVPSLSAIFDRDTQVLTGVAPADAWLEIELEGAHRRIQSSSDGTYAMDWADLAPRAGDWGTASYTDDQGNQTMVQFEVPYRQVYLPIIFRD